MMEELEITYEQVDRVILCGAFGTYMNAKSAARIGLIPEPLLSKVIAGGNAAGMGCRQITMDQKLFALTGELVQKLNLWIWQVCHNSRELLRSIWHFRRCDNR